MKLLSKTNRYYIIFSSVLLVLAAILFFIAIRFIIQDEVSEILRTELLEFEEEAATDPKLLTLYKPIEFEIEKHEGDITADSYNEVVIANQQDSEPVPYLELTAFRKFNGETYKIVLRESLIESDEIIFAIGITLGVVFGLLLLGLILFNNYLSRRLWLPFYRNLDEVKSFNISHSTTFPSVETDVDEFSDLNEALIKMHARISRDYQMLKEFTENASHEIQTPIAIIRAKIDALLQNTEDEATLKAYESIESSANRISRMSRELLLLAKIENNQYAQTERINPIEILREVTDSFSELIRAKEISLELCEEGDPVEIIANPILVEVMFSNLIKNAIEHNRKGGFIEVLRKNYQVTIINSGATPDRPTEELFNRFAKAGTSTTSSGLGLSIVAKICERYHYGISYQFENGKHIIELKLKEEVSVPTLRRGG